MKALGLAFGVLMGLMVPALSQVPPTASQVQSYSGLHAAAHTNDAAMIEALVGGGADLNARDDYGRTAAHVAAHASADDALKALAKAGADMTLLENDRYDVITIAAVADDPDLVKLAIELGGDPRAVTSRYDGTALIAAAHLGHAEVVQNLIDGGAPLDHVNNLGWTALIEAVILGDGGPRHQATVKALVDAGADKTIGDRDGITPLRQAISRGSTEIARLLKD